MLALFMSLSVSAALRQQNTLYQWCSCVSLEYYSTFQIDELYCHKQNLVGTLHATSLLWSTDMKTTVGQSLITKATDFIRSIDLT